MIKEGMTIIKKIHKIIIKINFDQYIYKLRIIKY